jgi:rhamnulokinase
MAGHFDGKRLSIEEATRFPNQGHPLADGWHWDAEALFQNITRGLAAAGAKFGADVVSVAVDTWGVDYGLLDAAENLINPPWMYRDSRTDGLMAEAERLIGGEDLWARTGIQPLFFNTLHQLMAEARHTPDALARATDLLFVPDLLNYRLSGVKAIERTIASTSELLRAGSAAWDLSLAEQLGIPSRLLKPVTEPAVVLGQLRGPLAAETGLHGVQVTTCGSHDTASAVAGVPATYANPLFLSSGTWSLLGRELPTPVLTEEARRARFSNEQGLCGTTRFLTNISGMWLLQECRRVWASEGDPADYAQLVESSRSSVAPAIIDSDAPAFEKSCDMPRAICDWIARSGQPQPEGKPALVRVILESLALKYRHTISRMRHLQPDLPDTIHIVGGGCQNHLLNQMTADATGLRVVAGPVEATAAGNILAQMMATGAIASLSDGRSILSDSLECHIFTPGDSAPWDDKELRFAQAATLLESKP